jgi:hypothetical protein
MTSHRVSENFFFRYLLYMMLYHLIKLSKNRIYTLLFSHNTSNGTKDIHNIGMT